MPIPIINYIISQIPIKLNNWSHVVATYNGSYETITVDGHVEEYQAAGVTWAALEGSSGTDKNDSNTTFFPYHFVSTTTSNKWERLRRGIATIDTSAIPNTATVSATVFSLFGNDKGDTFSPALSCNLTIYSSAPAANNTLAAGDFDSLGSTAFANEIAYSDLSIIAYNDFNFNAIGIAAVNLTGVTRLGMRESIYDAGTATPTWSSGCDAYFACWSAEKGAGFLPKLVVTYTAPPVVTSFDVGTITDNDSIYIAGQTTAINDTTITERGVVWDTSTHGDPGNVHPNVSGYSGNWTEVGSWDLAHGFFAYDAPCAPHTLYYWRAAVKNSDGIWAYGDEYDATTEGIPDVKTLDADLILDTSARLKGSIDAFYPPTDNAKTYGWQWDTTSGVPYANSYETTWPAIPGDPPIWPITTGTFTHSPSNLNSGTTYYYRFFAQDYLYGYSYGAELTFTTLGPKLWIEWEYAATFTDLSGNGNDATPNFRTASSENVTAALITFAPIQLAESSDNIQQSWGEIMTDAPTEPSTAYTEESRPGIFFEPLIHTLWGLTGLPDSIFWYNFAFFFIISSGMLIFRFFAANNQQALLLKCITMAVVMIFWALPGPNIYGMYVVLYFILWSIGVLITSRSFGW